MGIIYRWGRYVSRNEGEAAWRPERSEEVLEGVFESNYPAKNNTHREAMGIIYRWGRYVSRNKDSTG